MDLVAGVRKEGSRGGRGDFSWSDVATSSHRENYLGHSLMAPVGRWQRNKDLSWYAKGDKSEEATEARREEIRRVKEKEGEALRVALGGGNMVVPGAGGIANANEVPLGEREVREGKEGREVTSEPASGKEREVLRVKDGDIANGTPEERALKRIIDEEDMRKRRQSRSRSRERERRHRRHDDGEGRARKRHHHHHHRERDQSRDRSRNRSRDRESQRHRHHERYRERSYDRRRSRSRERRRSFSRDRNRDYERRR